MFGLCDLLGGGGGEDAGEEGVGGDSGGGSGRPHLPDNKQVMHA